METGTKKASGPGWGSLTRARFRVLAHPDRCRILTALDPERPVSVGALRAALGLGQSHTSHHLAWLRLAGLVAVSKEGCHHHYTLSPAGVELARVARAVDDPGQPGTVA